MPRKGRLDTVSKRLKNKSYPQPLDRRLLHPEPHEAVSLPEARAENLPGQRGKQKVSDDTFVWIPERAFFQLRKSKYFY